MVSKSIDDISSIIPTLSDPKFWTFFGTGLIISVVYMDPGNLGTDILGGASFGYLLLWAVWLSSFMAMFFQYLSGKLGIAGYSLPEIIKEKIKSKRLVFLYWILAEIAILATDLSEFLGIVIALNLLFKIPLIMGAFIAILDVFLFLVLTKKNFRILEYAFIIFVAVICISYIYEVYITKPDLGMILAYSLKPTLTPETLLLVVGMIGATIMPHALWVHSWLIKNKMKENKKLDKKTALRYHFTDNVTSLAIAAFINAAILIMAAAAFYNSGSKIATIEGAYKTLTPLFGSLASLVFAVALLASGTSSSMTGVLAGQSIMEGLTEFKINPAIRRLITRVINLIPILIALVLGFDPLRILVYSQVALSFLLPLPIIPLIIYSSDRKLMGELANRAITKIMAIVFTVLILALNIYLVYQTMFVH